MLIAHLSCNYWLIIWWIVILQLLLVKQVHEWTVLLIHNPVLINFSTLILFSISKQMCVHDETLYKSTFTFTFTFTQVCQCSRSDKQKLTDRCQNVNHSAVSVSSIQTLKIQYATHIHCFNNHFPGDTGSASRPKLPSSVVPNWEFVTCRFKICITNFIKFVKIHRVGVAFHIHYYIEVNTLFNLKATLFHVNLSTVYAISIGM